MIDLVIRLSEAEYDEILDAIEDAEIAGVGLGYLSIALKNGTPLPKGHGALKDADVLFEKFEETGWFNNADRDEIAEKILLDAPTIIEADKEGAGE